LFAAIAFMCGAAFAAPQFVLEEHPTLRFSDKTFVLGRVRWDYEHRGPEASLPAGKDEWGFVRRRLSIEGNVGGKIAFEVEADLEGEERWKDVYAEYIVSNALHVRAGKSVVPFGYERTTSIDVLDFAYRSMIATHLVPPRDQGIAAFGQVWGGKLSYDAGLFEEGTTRVGRVVAKAAGPGFRPGERLSILRGIEIGAAAMQGTRESDSLPMRGATALGVTFFRSDVLAEGGRRRISAHAAWRRGPAAVKTEYITMRDSDKTTIEPLDAAGWYVTGALVLTGESEADSHHPKRPLFRGGIGSIEVAARAERLAFDRGFTIGVAEANTYGLTWQPHRFFRVQWNAIRDVIAGSPRWSRVLRFHLTI
jgi:phosphate-selective porin